MKVIFMPPVWGCIEQKLDKVKEKLPVEDADFQNAF